jgi:hypothetical protein
MRWIAQAAAIASLVVLATCGERSIKPVEDLRGGEDLSQLALTSLKGTRDGDRLDVRAVYGDGSRQLRLDLRFRVTPPTKLESGTWTGLASGGEVQERSVTFLGGQSGPPSIGGRFDLVGRDSQALYRVTIPLQPLKERL